MIWILERNEDKLKCEIRQTVDLSEYEFEVTTPAGPAETLRFDSATALIDEYLRRQTALQAQGWRPRVPPCEL